MSKAVKIFKHFEAPKAEGTYYRLICLTGENKGTAYFLIDKRIVLGRSDQADIRVMDIKSSREHAEVIRAGKDFIITDLGSQNGIIVNDFKVTQHKLKDGDKVIIGKTVYKFTIVDVKPSLAEVPSTNEFQDEEFTEPEKKQNKRGFYILVGIIIGAVFLLIDDGNNDGGRSKKKKRSYKSAEISDEFTKLIKNKRKQDSKLKEQLNTIFQRGLREFREGNFYRAMSEFNLALILSPNDSMADFYLKKTIEALDKEVQKNFITARRDIESLKYSKAIISYCAVMRLLYANPHDDRYKEAEKGINLMEEKKGMEKGEVNCLQK